MSGQKIIDGLTDALVQAKDEELTALRARVAELELTADRHVRGWEKQSERATEFLKRAETAERLLAEATAREGRIADALEWVLPMGKGFAREHSVGRNREIVNAAESVLAAYRGEVNDH